MNQHTSTSSVQNDEIDLQKLFGLLVDKKHWIAAVTAASFLLAVLYTLLATPIYKADVLLQVEPKSSGASALLSESMDLFGDQKSEAATEIELIKSRMILGQTVDELNLTTLVQPDYLPFIGKGLSRLSHNLIRAEIAQFIVPPVMQEEHDTFSLEILDPEQGTYALATESGAILFEGQVGQVVRKKGVVFQVKLLDGDEGDSFTLTQASRLDAIMKLKKALSVTEQGKKTGILVLSYQGEHKDKIEAILNSVAQHYYQQNLARHSEEAQKSLAFLKTHLPQVKQDLFKAEETLNQYIKNNDAIDLNVSSEAQSVMQVIVNLEAQLNELQLKEREISHKFTRDHPVYIALIEKRRVLLQEKSRFDRQLQSLPEAQREILRLRRDVEVNQRIYVQLSNKQQELSIVRAGTVGNVRIVDAAQSYNNAVKPKKALIVVLAALLGAIAAIGFILVRAALNRGVTSAAEIEAIGLSVYASIPLSDWEKQQRRTEAKRGQKALNSCVLAQAQPSDLAVEALRSLRTSLHFAMLEARNNVVMISGPSPEVGKSFVTSNFAAVLAASGKKVLVIDADMRRGYLHKTFNLNNQLGLSSLLSDQSSLQDVVQKSAIQGVDVISRGPSAPNPAELLMLDRFSDMLQEVSQNYDFVLVDTPPILAVTDASIIGSHVGTNLMVGRFEKNPIKEILAAQDRFEKAGIKVNGFILNAVEKRAAADGYDYNYSYETVS